MHLGIKKEAFTCKTSHLIRKRSNCQFGSLWTATIFELTVIDQYNTKVEWLPAPKLVACFLNIQGWFVISVCRNTHKVATRGIMKLCYIVTVLIRKSEF